MDKETLSNYGWIVICVLVLVVMIALATPFGGYVRAAVKSTTAGLFETNRSALNSTGLINIADQSFDDGSNTTAEIKRSGIIPDGAKYIKADSSTLEGNGTNTLPDTPVAGDIYEEGDYKYTYNKGGNYGSEWSVVVKDKTKSTYGVILSEIAGKPVTNIANTFWYCESLTTAPTIPNSVTNMSGTFCGCSSLTTAPTIPNGVTNMFGAFSDCTSLTVAPEIPNSVTNMKLTFADCTSLTAAPTIPNSVTDMKSAFYSCTSLTTAPSIPNSVTNMNGTFQSCTSLSTAPTIPSSVNDMTNTFQKCTSLTTAPDIPNSVKNMDATFANCAKLAGTIKIDANPESYSHCLTNTQITEITGSTTLKSKLLATKY